MEAIILHLPGKRVADIALRLKSQNISAKRKIWTPGKSFNGDLADANILALHLDSPQRPLLSMLPDLRRKKYLMPIVILDENQNEESKKMAMELSADAYFSKPFLYQHLAAQLKQLVYKKAMRGVDRWLKAFDLWLNLENRFVRRDKKVMSLRNKEFSLLEYFMINRGKILTRNAILEYVWDRNANFASNTVDVHINRLRRKIDDPFREKLIHTVPCVGYIFDRRREPAPAGKRRR